MSTLAHDPARRLPRRASVFFGRREELDAVRAAVERGPITTIVGFGGFGKSRLALQFAESADAEFPGGIAWIECNRSASTDALARAVLAAFDTGSDGADPLDQLAAIVRSSRTLVIFDGAEHHLDGVASVVAALIASLPAVRVLCTSREPLHLTGEAIVLLSGLSEENAVALFADRAGLENHRFALGDTNRERVASISARLDGMALAIELAASLTRIMSLETIEDRLHDRFRTLARSGRPDAPARHQSLAAVADWSYDALEDDQRQLFRRLGVFAATFSLDAVVGVCSDERRDEWMIVDDLAVLVDKSLVVCEQLGEAAQYRLLDTLREYAVRHLRETGEYAALVERLDRWCLGRVDDLDVVALLPNIEDFRAATERALADPARVADAVALLSRPRGLWYVARDEALVATRLRALADGVATLSGEDRGRAWLAFSSYAAGTGQSTDVEIAALEKAQALLADTADALTRIQLRHGLLRARIRAGPFAGLPEMADECVLLAQALGDQYLEAQSLRLLGFARYLTGEYLAAEAAMLAALDIFGELKAAMLESATRQTLAEIQFAAGRPEDAIRTIERVEASPVPLRDDHVASMAIFFLAAGRAAEARASAREAIELSRHRPDDSMRFDVTLAVAACFAEREPSAAAHLLGYLEASEAAAWKMNDASVQYAHRHAKAAVERALGSSEFARQCDLGRGLSDDGAAGLVTELCASEPPPERRSKPTEAPANEDGRQPPQLSTLTVREWTIAKRVARGMTNGTIAEELFLSRRTVESHVATILRKANVPSRVALAALISSLRALR